MLGAEMNFKTELRARISKQKYVHEKKHESTTKGHLKVNNDTNPLEE